MSRETTIRDNLANYIRSRYTQVKAKPVQGVFNYKCFYNSVEYAKNHGGRVFECMIIDGNWPSLHYVVKKGSIYQEVTLGYTAENYEYYILREIPESDYMRIDEEFNRAIESYLRQFSTWFDRNILRIDRAC